MSHGHAHAPTHTPHLRANPQRKKASFQSTPKALYWPQCLIHIPPPVESLKEWDLHADWCANLSLRLATHADWCTNLSLRLVGSLRKSKLSGLSTHSPGMQGLARLCSPVSPLIPSLRDNGALCQTTAAKVPCLSAHEPTEDPPCEYPLFHSQEPRTSLITVFLSGSMPCHCRHLAWVAFCPWVGFCLSKPKGV